MRRMERDRYVRNWSFGAARAADESCAVHQGAELISGDSIDLLSNGLTIDNYSKVNEHYRYPGRHGTLDPRQNF